jgi:two-component system, OmpR family, response regulator
MTRILYIDDEADIREIAALSLELAGDLDVRCCASGAEGVAVARAWPPALILLDVMMPRMDGPATLAELAADPATASIPVVFITARTQAADVDALMALGARGVIAKPFDPMTLAAEVKALLA